MPYGPKRLTYLEAHEIRVLYSKGEYTQTQLAQKFEVSQSMVCKIINNQAHKQAAHINVGGEAGVKLGFNYAN